MKLPMRPKHILTIKTALNKAVLELQKAKIDSAWLDAELLLAFVLEKSRSQILAHDDTSLSKTQYLRFNKLIRQRLDFVPTAYLLGSKEFYGLTFKVTKDTLVPRPESELMVEEALKLVDTTSLLIDIGTGSGCLIISAIKNSQAKGYGLDISSKALKIAKINAKNLNVNKKIKFIKSNLLSNLKIPRTQKLIILANLPYLNVREMKEKTISKEPKSALYGGTDGLIYYKKLAKQLKKYSSYTLLAEINPGQKNSFKKIFTNSIFKKDLSGKIRLAIVTK